MMTWVGPEARCKVWVTYIGVGQLHPTEEPTTRLGSSSSGGLWGHQLAGGTPQETRRAWTWVTRAELACLWVLPRPQLSKH